MKSPDRPDKQFKKLPKNCMEDLQEYGLCDLSDKDAESLVDSSIYKIIKQSNRRGPFALNDVNGIAMLTWQMKESVNILFPQYCMFVPLNSLFDLNLYFYRNYQVSSRKF